MATTTRSQSRYDHRLRDLVCTTRDIDFALKHGVPRSTARGWLTKPGARVVTVDVLNRDTIQLQQEVLRLRARIGKLTASYDVLDGRNVLRDILEPTQGRFTYLHDAEGRVETLIDQNSNRSTLVWDGSGNRSAFVDAQNGRTISTFPSLPISLYVPHVAFTVAWP